VALYSAELVWRFALDHLKADHKDQTAADLPALFETVSKAAKAAPTVAQDAAAAFDLSAILGTSHIRKG
jgi:hypothetical protein